MAEMTLDQLEQFAETGVRPVPPVQPRRRMESELTSRLQRFRPTGDPIPLDTQTGISFLNRLNLSRAPDTATRSQMLADAYKGSSIEPVQMYEGADPLFVIRGYVDPETGLEKDVLVDETDITLKDVADLGQTGIEILGSFMAMRGGSPVTGQLSGLTRGIAEAAIGATGGQLAGAASDIQARAAAGQPLQPMETAGRRSVNAFLETGMGIGMAGLPLAMETAAKRLTRGVPVTDEAAMAVAARNRLAGETDVSVPMTLGQQTGREGIRRAEEFLENVTFGGGPQRQFRQAQEEQIENLQRALIEKSGPARIETLPTKDVIGQQAVQKLRNVTDAARNESLTTRESLLSEGLMDLSGALQRATGLDRQILTREAGTSVQTFMGLKKEAFDSIANDLNQAVIQAAGTDSIIPSSLIRAPIKGLREKLKRPDSEELYRFVPANVRAFLDDIENLPDRVALKDVRNLRTAVNEAINESEILGSSATGNLKQISKGLTEALENSVAFLSQKQDSPAASEALARFNQFYRENIEGFQVKGITDILADPTQRKLGPFAVFDQAAKDPDQYFRLKDVLTKPLKQEGKDVGPIDSGSMTWATFKQAMLGEMVDESRMVGNRNVLDARKFFDRLGGLKREVRNDLLGAGGPAAEKALARLEQLQNPKVNADEALAVLRQGGDNAVNQIVDLANKESFVSDLYRNQVIKRFVKGEIGSESIQPGQFVDRFLDVAPVQDIRTAVDLIGARDENLLGQIRQKTIQNLFQKARFDFLDEMASAKKLAKEINTPEMQQRLDAVLGAPGLQRLNDFLTVLAQTQKRKESAGTLARNTILSKGLLGSVGAAAKNTGYWLVGAVLSNPRLHGIATSPIQPADSSKAVRRVLMEADFLRALTDEYKDDSQRQLLLLDNAASNSGPQGRTLEDLERMVQ